MPYIYTIETDAYRYRVTLDELPSFIELLTNSSKPELINSITREELTA